MFFSLHLTTDDINLDHLPACSTIKVFFFPFVLWWSFLHPVFCAVSLGQWYLRSDPCGVFRALPLTVWALSPLWLFQRFFDCLIFFYNLLFCLN